jgi:hypothetical protein
MDDTAPASVLARFLGVSTERAEEGLARAEHHRDSSLKLVKNNKELAAMAERSAF